MFRLWEKRLQHDGLGYFTIAVLEVVELGTPILMDVMAYKLTQFWRSCLNKKGKECPSTQTVKFLQLVVFLYGNDPMSAHPLCCAINQSASKTLQGSIIGIAWELSTTNALYSHHISSICSGNRRKVKKHLSRRGLSRTRTRSTYCRRSIHRLHPPSGGVWQSSFVGL